MPELSVPRSNHGFPAICILTGDTEGVHPEDLILTRRNAALRWALIGFLILGWIGALLAAHYIPEKCPIRLPVSRRGYRRWRTARAVLMGVCIVSFVLTGTFLHIIRAKARDGVEISSPTMTWMLLSAALALPPIAYWLLLLNNQPWLRESRGLVVDLWIPSAEAAAAIRAHMQPLLERMKPSSASGPGRPARGLPHQPPS